MLPFTYPLRNLWRRRARTLATLLGVAATTVLIVTMSAFAGELEDAAGGSAREDVAFLIGTSAEVDLVRSVVPRGNAETAAASAPGVLAVDGRRAASVELHIASRSGNRIALLRGVRPGAYLVHTQLTVVEGREPREPFEIMVGRMAAARMELEEEDLAVGKTIELENRKWRVCGRFAAPGTVLEAELWARLDDLMVATKREDVSCVAVRLKSPDELDALSLFAAKRVDLEMVAVPEKELMAALQRSLTHITALARLMAALVLVAGGFACANTMFAAVLARTKELAMLRTLGYSPASVAVSIVQEALLVAFLGAALGLAAATLVGDIPLRFPMGALHLELDTLHRGLGLGAALAAGLLGGLVPAVHAVRTPLVDGLAGKN